MLLPWKIGLCYYVFLGLYIVFARNQRGFNAINFDKHHIILMPLGMSMKQSSGRQIGC